MQVDYTYEIDWTRQGTFSHANSDITDYVVAANWRFGMDHPLQSIAMPASGTIIVRNDNREWYKDNLSSPFYSFLKPGVLLRVKISIDGAAATQYFVARIRGFATGAMRSFEPEVMLYLSGPLADMQQEIVRVPSVVTDQRIDQEIERILVNSDWVYPYKHYNFIVGGALLGWTTYLPDNSSYLDLEESITTLEYAGDNTTADGVEANLYSVLNELVTDEMGGRLYWNARNNKITFHNRHHNSKYGANDLDVTTYYDIQSPLIFGDLMANKVTVDYSLRELGTAGSTIWSLPGRWTVRARSDVRKRVTYRMDSYPNARIAKYNLVDNYPVEGTDWVAEDRDGIDITEQIGFYVKAEARSADITITNQTYDTAYITTAQVRGQPLLVHPRENVTEADGLSIDAYGLAAVGGEQYSLTGIGDDDLAKAFAEYSVRRLKTPKARVPSLDFPLVDATKTWLTNLIIGSNLGINWSSTETDHTGTYVVIGEAHQVNHGQEIQHFVSLVLQPKPFLTNWHLGVSGYSKLGEETYIAF